MAESAPPLISIIIPVYNTAAFLPRCMDSVLGQTHHQLEVILVDDGSTDDSPGLCDAYAQRDARVKVIHQRNGGAAAAKNAGLDAASGAYLGFVDSDDWLEPDTYAYLLALLQQHKGDIAEAMLEVAHTDAHCMRPVTPQVRLFTGDDILVHYLRHNEYAMGLRLYKQQIFNGLRFDAGRMNEDVLAGFLALGNAQRLVVSNQPKYFYFSNPTGVSESPLCARDFDLLYACERLDELTAGTSNKTLRKLALTKSYRGPFTLLVKMALFGCSDQLDERQTKRQLQAQTRRHYGFLMASSMPFNRKLLLTAVCVSYPLVRLAGSMYHKARGRAG